MRIFLMFAKLRHFKNPVGAMVSIYGCGLMLLMCCFCAKGTESEIHTDDPRFFFSHNKPVKPTSAITHHEPGLPPGWTRPPTRPTRQTPNLSYRWINKDTGLVPVTELIVESQAINIINSGGAKNDSTGLPPGVHPPMAIVDDSNPNKNIITDWISGLFGRPTQKPPTKPTVDPGKCQKCSCGMSYKYNRIVGGVETKANAYPWMVYLTYSGRFYCGASVINDRYLLTAAHCVHGFPKERILAVFLDHDRATTSETKTFTRRIGTVLKHTGYGTGGPFNNDIALLRLNEALDFSGLLKPVCLPPIGKSFTGYKGIVTGWGATEQSGQVSTVLREVEVPIMSNTDCVKTGYGRKITDNMICAGYSQGTKDSCQGDSGGPMHVVLDSGYTIVGIVSWGEGCAEPNYPGVYTRVNRYITWIKSNTRDGCYC